MKMLKFMGGWLSSRTRKAPKQTRLSIIFSPSGGFRLDWPVSVNENEYSNYVTVLMGSVKLDTIS